MESSFAPIDGRKFPRFSGVKTFFRLPHLTSDEELKNANVVIVGAPYDGGVSYRPGARFGPEHVRSMSSLGRGYQPALDVHVFKRLNVCDGGDISVVPQDIERTHQQIKEHVARILSAGATPIVVGGDHSTTIGTMQAMFEKYGRFGVVHFDAHTDTYPAAWDCDIHHGTFMRIAHERGWIQNDKVIQIGVRGPFASEDDLKTPNAYGFDVVSVDDVRINGLATVVSKIEKLRGLPIFLSLDVDCLDPAFAPGTGTPVPGGLTSWEVLQMIRAMKGLNLVGADIVEVSPPYDVSGITSLFAVTAMGEMLAVIASSR